MSWKFWELVSAKPVSDQLKAKLRQDRGLTDADAASLRMMQERGSYSGRKVTRFVIFDPATAKRLGVEPRRFNDIDGRTTLHAGHIEDDGHIVLKQAPSP